MGGREHRRGRRHPAGVQAVPGARGDTKGELTQGEPVQFICIPDARPYQVWHNYSFDKHVFENHGIVPRGFGGDTMHMARLWNSSRLGSGLGYSLESLTEDDNLMKDAVEHLDAEVKKRMGSKISMKELFGKPNIRKDLSEGKLVRCSEASTPPFLCC